MELNPLHGFRGYLIGQLTQLEPEQRLRLFAILNFHGWPVHLQNLYIADIPLGPTTPWLEADNKALLIVREAGVSFDAIARVVFEGRSAAECRAHYNELLHSGWVARARDAYMPQPEPSSPFPTYDDSGFDQGNEATVQQQPEQEENDRDRSLSVPDTPTPVNKEITPQTMRSQERLAQLMEDATDSELSSARSSFSNAELLSAPDTADQQLPPAASTPVSKSKKANNKLLTDLKKASSASRASPSSGTNKKYWTDEHVHLLHVSIANGLTPKEMQEAYFPFRTIGAVDTKISKMKKAGITFPTSRRWTDYSSDLLLRVAQDGTSWEDVCATHFPLRTPEECREYYRFLVRNDAEDDSKDAKRDNVEEDNENDQTDYKDKKHQKHDGDPNLDVADDSENLTELEIARMDAIERLLPFYGGQDHSKVADQRLWLKKALDKSAWPTHLATLEYYKTKGSQVKDRKWLPEDSNALQLIRQLPDPPSNRLCAEVFFPGRNADGVRNHGALLMKRLEHARDTVNHANFTSSFLMPTTDADGENSDDLSLI